MTSRRKPIRVLFVCMGNICRSPAADIVFRHMVARGRPADRIEIDSAGTIGYHAGNPPDPRMSAELASRGYPVNGSARQVTRADLDDFDFVLAMDDDNVDDLTASTARAPAAEKSCPSSPTAPNTVRDVPDPYYGGRSGFARVADIVEDGCRGLLDELRKQLD